MNKKTLEALKASIRHWEENLATDDPLKASSKGTDCALCWLFFDKGCFGCPVNYTGAIKCWDTPFDAAAYGISKWKAGGPKPVAEIQAEIDFLKSLLPEGKE